MSTARWDLGRWTRFAAKGGIGKCTAIKDCVAQGREDLMFLVGDEIVVLMQLGEEKEGVYLVRCNLYTHILCLR